MPFYKGLTAGFLSSSRFNGPYTWSEGRFYANLKPCDWFSFATNYAISSYGSTMGAALGFHAAGFNMFLGAMPSDSSTRKRSQKAFRIHTASFISV